MINSVYSINKNINKSIEFKGLKAQYIWYLGGGLVCLLILFAILYLCGFGLLVCLPVTVILGSVLFMHIYKLSRTYGEYGMMKKIAKRSIPPVIKNNSLVQLKQQLLHAQTI
ncbi:DUF4133 domain-containing protein [Lacibacter sp.]|uniref:DUF4133 domain-containing protein n=1 Tax=Lacibacter sp. TaxID=1915409 RepID=UPI002B4B88D7|nr:DUF4133 domain-containing protein [Lacibacter sp.]HLP37003.1 DUF4133 domain-containing protein [Lacibacter sp.]